MLIMAFEMVEFQSLKNYLSSKKVKGPKLNHIFNKIVESIKKLHRKYIAHREIKMENFYITDNKEVLVSGFGRAKRFPSHRQIYKNQKIGNLQYMAPEIFENSNINCEFFFLQIF